MKNLKNHTCTAMFILFIALSSFVMLKDVRSAEYPIIFETLKKHDIPAGGTTLIILVSEKETKDNVMKLAKILFEEYTSKGSFYLQIFDSKEAYINRDNPEYPEKKYWKHFLVDGSYNKNTGYKNLDWVADGRDK